MAKDIYWWNTVLAMHFDGADASTTFTDQKNHSVVPTGNAKISTTQSKFGGSSAYFDGTGDYLSVPGSQDFVFGNGDFTIECWLNTTDNNFCLVDYFLSGVTTSWQLYVTAAGKLQWFANNAALKTGAVSVNTGAWVHVVATRLSGVLSLYVNGVGDGAGTQDNINYATQQNTLSIGAQVNSRNATYDFAGYIDELRITKACRYPNGFTPAVTAFLEDGYTVSGAALDTNGNGVSRTMRAYRRDTGALVGTTNTNPSTGAYTVNVTHDGEVQVVLLDDAAGAVENDQILRTTPL
jgi:hypothetical protein